MIKNTIAFIWQFSCDDFKNKYAGSLLGALWAFIQPLSTVIVYWFVFQMGFRNKPIEGFPFILWLMSGLIGWFFFSEAISNSTSCLIEYSYLVKKVLFNIDILPLVKVCSVMYVQVFLIVFNIIIFALYGYKPDLYLLQIFYYLLYMIILTVGISYLTSSLFVFFRDMNQIISILLQIIFWTTPFVWDISYMPETVQKVIRVMPMYYVATGYRNAFIQKIWFWTDWQMAICYWITAFVIFGIGLWVFKKLRPHFADVL